MPPAFTKAGDALNVKNPIFDFVDKIVEFVGTFWFFAVMFALLPDLMWQALEKDKLMLGSGEFSLHVGGNDNYNKDRAALCYDRYLGWSFG